MILSLLPSLALSLVSTKTFIACVKQSNLCHNFAGWSRHIILTSKTLIRPFPSKEVMNIALSISVFLGYKGLKWIRNLKINHFYPNMLYQKRHSRPSLHLTYLSSSDLNHFSTHLSLGCSKCPTAHKVY